jgi:hypothetical protein
MSVVYFYLKFCQEEQYARDFVAGRLWMNHRKPSSRSVISPA